ncbi:phosphatidylinositol mannoside acyltransferase [Aquihabitans sp. McL0605]|uniref:phosphatidylinositol mannoside acyltransferase n=1 Tax=Aquihabitans sp. McL0605 TaxID=3415671 RepID=UPI003CF6E1F5
MLPDKSYAAYRVGSAIARLLPSPVLGPFGEGAGWVAARVMDGRREMVERHQLRVRPDLTPAELNRAVDQVFASYSDYWIESFRLPGTPASVLEARMHTEGFEHVRAAYDAGHGVITAMPHLGAWEWAAFWLTACQHIDVTTVVEPIEPPELASWFVDLREQLGMEIVPLGPDSGARVARALSAGRLLSLVCDRDIAGTGIEVEFFGERTTLPAGPATLALRSGAPLMAATCYFDGDTHRGVVRPPIDTTRQGKLREDVARVTQVLAHELEELIRLAPEQWHLLQPNWPSDHALHEKST